MVILGFDTIVIPKVQKRRNALQCVSLLALNHQYIHLMPGLYRTPERLGTDLRLTAIYCNTKIVFQIILGVGRPSKSALESLLNTRNNSGIPAIQIDKLHGRL